MEAATVRRFCVVLLTIFLALPLVAAAPDSILGTPTLLVYPFSVNGGDVNREAGSRLSIAIATQIADLGGVNVKPAPPGVERQSYLDAAHHEGVDYYISGYLTPLGDGVSLVEQLVSTQTGIVVYSNTAQVRSYADAAGQGDILREALLRHRTRNLGAYAAPPPQTTVPSPTPGAGTGAQANLGRLFGRRQKRSAPAASPSPAPIATALVTRPRTAASASVAAAHATTAPSPASIAAAQRPAGFGMLTIDGPAESDRRMFTTDAIRNVMLAAHQRVAAAAGAAPAACRDANVGTLIGGHLSTRKRTILGQPQTTATLEFVAYDCSGSVVYQKTFARDERGDWRTAVDRVVQSAVGEFLHGPAGTRRSS